MNCKSVAVLFKVVPDPDGIFKPDGSEGVTGAHLPQVPSVFDENAVEAAVQIKEATGCRVTVVCLGQPAAEPMLRRTLAMGADEIVLIEGDHDAWESREAAGILAAALRGLGGFDLVLCGREAADTGAGLVGPYVAQLLGMPFLTLASEISVEGGRLMVRRPCEGGSDAFACQPPLLLTVTGEANRPRMPSVVKMLQVKKSPVRRLAVGDLGVAALPDAGGARRQIPAIEGNCTFIEGETAAAKVSKLLEVLRQEKVVA